MKIKKVVEEFLELVSLKKVEQAEELIVEEAKGREDDVAGYLMAVGLEAWDKGYHFMTFYCLEAAGKVAKSEDIVEVIIQNLEIAHYNYAILLKGMKEYEEAEFHYRECLRINPEYAEAHYNYAVLLKERKEYEEAEFHYRECLRINPEYAEAHNNYANLLKERKEYEEAEFHYRECLRINPEFAKAYGNLGILYSDQKRYPEAIESIESASRIFKEKKMLPDHRKAEALIFSIKARISWRDESWEDTKNSLEEAIKNFKACGMEEHVEITSNTLYLVTIDESFIKSLTPRDLLDLRDRIQDLYNVIMKFRGALEESEIYEHKILAAKFTCIQFLNDALTFQPLDFDDLDTARKILRDEGFTQAVQLLNVLESFAADLDQYKSVGLENIPEDQREILLGKLTSMRYLDE